MYIHAKCNHKISKTERLDITVCLKIEQLVHTIHIIDLN